MYILRNMPKICDACSNRVFSHRYCKNHQYLRLDYNVIVITPQLINKISPKLRKKTIEYSKLRIPFIQSNPLCRANLVNCTKIVTDVHHMKGRGKYLLDTTTWLPVCRNCHHRIELFPKEAKELNLSQSRL